MECKIFSEESDRCWLHPGRRIVGVCSLCLNDRLGRLSRHPRQFIRHSSYFSSEQAAEHETEGSRFCSEMDRAEADDLRVLSTSDSLMKRSKSVSDRTALSSSGYGLSSEETLSTSSTVSSAKATFEKLFTACHSGSEMKLSSEKHKAAAAPTTGSKSLKTLSLLGSDSFSSKKKSLNNLFLAAKGKQAAFAGTESETIKKAVGVNNIKDERDLKADRDPERMQTIASLIQTDLQHKDHPWYSLFFKDGKTKEVWRTQEPQDTTVSNDEDLNFCANSAFGGLDSEPSIPHSRWKSVRASSWRLEPKTAAVKGFPRSRSVSCGATHYTGLLAVRDGDMPTMKQVSPLMPHSVLDRTLDTATGISNDSREEARKTISSLIALDLSESKNCKASWRWHAQSKTPVHQSFTPRSKQEHFHHQTHSLLDGFQAGKSTKENMSSSCKQKKLQILPLFHSKDYSIINFSVSPLRFTKRKRGDKVDLKLSI